jgi:RNA polymerase sigma factor (sigma-70 family)
MAVRARGEAVTGAEHENELLKALRDGREDAFVVLQGRYRTLVWSVCRRILLDRSEAEDATQQTFVKFWLKQDAIQLDRPLWPWLRMIALKTCLDRLRRFGRLHEVSFDASGRGQTGQTASPEMLPTSPAPEPDERVRIGELRLGFDQCWRLLEARQRAFLQSIDWSDWKQSSLEIAEATGMSHAAIRISTVRYARRLLECLRAKGYAPSPSELLDILVERTNSKMES